MLDFFIKVGKLKQIKRKGWLKEEISQPESVADHCFRTIVVALILGSKLNLNLVRLLKLAIVHDLAESIVGDITPYDQDFPQKSQKEADAMKDLTIKAGIDLLELWNEYENGKTEEAKICRQVDKFEMILQAYEYEKTYNIDLEEFWQAEKDISLPLLSDMLYALRLKRRDNKLI